MMGEKRVELMLALEQFLQETPVWDDNDGLVRWPDGQPKVVSIIHAIQALAWLEEREDEDGDPVTKDSSLKASV